MDTETKTTRAEHAAGQVRAMRCSDGWHVVTNVGRREVARCHAGTGYDDATDEANARRLALCWNACEGVADMDLRPGCVAELRAACRFYDRLVSDLLRVGRYLTDTEDASLRRARAALARADGEAVQP